MVSVEKEILCPGRVFDPKTKRWYTFTSKDVREGARNLSTMYTRGRRIPLVWEHQDVEENDPAEWKARFAKHTFGYAGPARVSTPEDVRKGLASRVGTLIARQDIYDPKDAEQLKRLKVSPKLYSGGYTDSDGAEYSGTTVAHIAATNSPVQHWQAPFHIELSDPTPVYLSYAAPKKSPRAKTSRACPAHNRRRDGRALSTTNPEPNMADEKDDDKEMDTEGDGGAGGGLKKLIESLRKHGMNIPADVKDIDTLAIVVDALSGDSAESEVEDEMDNPDDDMDAPGAASGADTTAPAGGAPMLMSTLDADPVRRKRARQAVKPDRDDAIARVNAALGKRKLAGPVARKLIRVFESVSLSVTRDGDTVDADPKSPRYKNALKALEAAEAGRPVDGIDLSSTAAGDAPPAHLLGAADAKRQEALGLWYVGRGPKPE